VTEVDHKDRQMSKTLDNIKLWVNNNGQSL